MPTIAIDDDSLTLHRCLVLRGRAVPPPSPEEDLPAVYAAICREKFGVEFDHERALEKTRRGADDEILAQFVQGKYGSPMQVRTVFFYRTCHYEWQFNHS